MSESAKSAALRDQSGAARAAVMRSQLGRVRGLGAGHGGTGHWWGQRLSSLALVPLTLWFFWTMLHFIGLPRAGVAHYVANPVNAGLFAALVIAAYHHAQAGLQVIMEDYIHTESVRMTAILLMKGLIALLALISLISVVKLAYSG